MKIADLSDAHLIDELIRAHAPGVPLATRTGEALRAEVLRRLADARAEYRQAVSEVRDLVREIDRLEGQVGRPRGQIERAALNGEG